MTNIELSAAIIMLVSFVSFIVGLYSKGNATLEQIQDTVRTSSALNLSQIGHMKQLVSNLSEASSPEWNTDNTHLQALKAYLDKSEMLYSDVETEYRRRKLLVREGLVLPTSFKIGTRHNYTATGLEQLVDVTAQYISVIDTLMNVATSKSAITKHPNQPNILTCFEDTATYKGSEYYQQHPNAHRLTLYHDDIECGNNVGSRAGVNKLTMFYMSVDGDSSNLETKGKLTSIHLVLVCHSSDITAYGYSAVLRPFIDDLMRLDCGIECVTNQGETQSLFARLEHVAGDNLAANQILGLVTSFTRSHFCRFCYVSAADAALYTNANDAPKRTKASHQKDVEMAAREPDSYKKTGVKGACVLDELDYFSGIESTVPDVMLVLVF